MIRLRCEYCGETTEPGASIHEYKTNYYTHRQECQARTRAIFYARNHVKEETP